MNSTQTNFFKTNKSKLTNLYSTDAFKNINLDNFPRGKTSCSPKRNTGLNDIFKKAKLGTKLPLMNNYNNPYKLMDVDKLNEELILHKNEINKKNKELHNLKIAFIKLDEENKKVVKILEEIIIESGRNQKNSEMMKMTQDELENEIKNIMAISQPSEKSLLKLKECHTINSLKRQVYEFKFLLNSKDEELTNLKKSSRIAKYHELEIKMKASIDELITMKDDYNKLLILYNEKEIRLKELIEEKETLKTLNNKYKSQFEDIKEKLISYQEMNIKLSDQIKSLDGRNSNCKYQLSAIKNVIREKNNEINYLKEELISVEVFKHEKDKKESELKNLSKNLGNIKDELENKNKKLRELEKSNTEFKLKSDEYFIENQLIKKDNPQKAYIDIINENLIIIKDLKDENKKLKTELWKYDKNSEYNPTIQRESSFFREGENSRFNGEKISKKGSKNIELIKKESIKDKSFQSDKKSNLHNKNQSNLFNDSAFFDMEKKNPSVKEEKEDGFTQNKSSSNLKLENMQNNNNIQNHRENNQNDKSNIEKSVVNNEYPNMSQHADDEYEMDQVDKDNNDKNIIEDNKIDINIEQIEKLVPHEDSNENNENLENKQKNEEIDKINKNENLNLNQKQEIDKDQKNQNLSENEHEHEKNNDFDDYKLKKDNSNKDENNKENEVNIDERPFDNNIEDKNNFNKEEIKPTHIQDHENFNNLEHNQIQTNEENKNELEEKLVEDINEAKSNHEKDNIEE